MILFASYAPIGGGVMLLCQLAIAIPAAVLLVGMIVTSTARMQHPKYWTALGCVSQPIPLAFALRELGQFSAAFDIIWLTSMGLFLVGFLVLAIWPAER